MENPAGHASQSDEMACNELVELVTDYLEGTLDKRDQVRFQTHLAQCPYCLDYVDQFRETIAATGELRLDSLAPERRAKLIAAFRGWRGQPSE